jgi:hypothetical protein
VNLNLLYGGFGTIISVAAAAGGASGTVTGSMGLADACGAVLFNASDSGNHALVGLLVVAPAQTPTTTAAAFGISTPFGALLVATETSKQHALNILLGS